MQMADRHRPHDDTPTIVPVAFLARTSTEDRQDPTLAIPRQLDSVNVKLPPGFVIVAHFYDVESGRTLLNLRGQSNAYQAFDIPVPRDGSIADLLAEAQRPDRRFVAVVCESIERIARTTYYGTKIEHELEQAGVALLAADEGIDRDAVRPTGTGGPKNATSVLTRRVKQAISEWYVLQMLELSWKGFMQHTAQGWNIGKPPYGYIGERHPHPVKAKREEGITKHRLLRDPVRGPVVTQIFVWRALERLSYQHLADRLNTDLDRYPPPVPVERDSYNIAIGAWTPTAVRDILNNPKYTGFMVWNRRKRSRPDRGIKGRVNPPTEWVWSPGITHEPLTTRAHFDAASPVGRYRQGSRSKATNNAHPETKRSYRYRSYIRCDICARRMFGKTRKRKTRADDTYYACVTKREHHKKETWYEIHPPALTVNEDVIDTFVARFFNERIFGVHRLDYLEGPTEQAIHSDSEATAARCARQIDDLDAANKNLIASLQQMTSSGDPEIDAQWRAEIQRQFTENAKRRQALAAEVEELAKAARPKRVGARELVDQLPQVELNVLDLPEEKLRQLFDAFQLEIRYDRHLQRITLRVAVRAEMVDVIRQAAAEAAASSPPVLRQRQPGETAGADAPASAPVSRSHVLRAPGRIRTCAPASGEIYRPRSPEAC
ncbi:recombinase family protein [Dactylosporangium aurantiacum]|uniref:Recombinase family protein n=2 Tax=Dactylosporangium aurantiacum TaxID=35754 RepID=A0A9Q9IUW0_9ACTN|nr:recombinase family protein [Dactylosporangium aurantiacum]